MLEHEPITAHLQEAAILAEASWPYRHAAPVLERLTGAVISAEAIRQVSMACGRTELIASRKRRSQNCKSWEEKKINPPRIISE